MTDQTEHELQPEEGASLHTEETTALAPELGELSGVEKAKIITCKYLQDHDYKVFTNKAYKGTSQLKKRQLLVHLLVIHHIYQRVSKLLLCTQGPYTYPNLSTFSGDPARSDVAYEVCKYEVECLMREGYSECVILHAIRRSLKTQASKLLCDLEQMLQSVKS
jgi:hypothetical protein